jgi:predicted PurR-regulated permease PerM
MPGVPIVKSREGPTEKWRQPLRIILIAGLALVAALWLYRVREAIWMVLTPFFFSLILAYLLAPVIKFMESRRISRLTAIIVVYLVFAIVLLIFCVRVVPAILDDLEKLVGQLPAYAASLQDIIEHLQEDYRRFNLPPNIREVIDNNISGLEENLTRLLEKLYQFLLGLFARAFLLFLVPIITFYLLKDEEVLKAGLLELLPRRIKPHYLKVTGSINTDLGAFIRGLLLVSLVVAVLTYIGLLLIGLDFALVLALIVGLTNLIPYIGPVAGALPALLVALLDSPALALKVLLLIVAVQQLESQLIAPYIIGRSVRLHPLAIILVLLIGGRLFGFTGLLLAVPATIVIRIIFTHLYKAWQSG